MKPNAVIMKVSLTTETERNLKCLNIKQVEKPKNTPIEIETIPRDKNSVRIKKGVEALNDCDYSCSTVLNKTIETMSLNTPSPKMHEYSLGCAL
jgi:hypothetical protein